MEFLAFANFLMTIFLILKWAFVCLSAPVKLQEVDRLKRNTDSSRSCPSLSDLKCLWTCLAGERSEVCFNESISDIRPAPVLPDYVCDATECLRSAGTCPTKVTTFPFECMLQRRAVMHRSDGQNVESVCNVPVKRMRSCVFSPPSGNSEVFSHAHKVTFEIRRRGSTSLGSKACVCYDGQWIAWKALKPKRLKAVKPSHIFCDMQSSKRLEYLQVQKVQKPEFSNNGTFVYRLYVEINAIRQRDSFVPQEPGRRLIGITL